MSAWTLEIEGAQWGTVPSVNFVARRNCGREERFEASLWPAGWRVLRTNLDVPDAVRREAVRIARGIWGGQ